MSNSEQENRKKKTVLQRAIYEHGKIPPQAVDIEEKLLGIMMFWDTPFVKKVIAKCQPEFFYKESHQKIFNSIKDLFEKGIKPELLEVFQDLKSKGTADVAGGAYYLTTLIERAVSEANAEYDLIIIYQQFLKRELIRISNEVIKDSFEETIDVLEIIERLDKSLKNELNYAAIAGNVEDKKSLISEVKSHLKSKASSSIFIPYRTGWNKFDNIVTTSISKIYLLAGAAKDGKTKFLSAWMFRLLENNDDVSIRWHTYEDNSSDIVFSWLSYKSRFKTKTLKMKKNFTDDQQDELERYLNEFNQFDITFSDSPMYSNIVVNDFKAFCEDRKNNLNILVIDNLLSMKDKERYPRDLNSMMDDVLAKLLACKQETRAMIVIVHHFNDAQMNKENIKTGYRPMVTDIKGSEGARRVPNAVLLVNNPSKRKDLIGEYIGDERENLKRMFILDSGAIRDDNNEDESGLIHFWGNLDNLSFEEI